MLHALLEAKRKQFNTLMKTAAENIFVNKTGLKQLTFEFGKVPHCQLWLFITVEDKRTLETSLKNVMFHPAYSPDNIAPVTVISQGLPQERKHTQGETAWTGDSGPVYAGGAPTSTASWVQPCRHSEADQGISLSRTSRTTQIHLLSAFMGLQQQFFPAKRRQSQQIYASTEKVKPVLWSYRAKLLVSNLK